MLINNVSQMVCKIILILIWLRIIANFINTIKTITKASCFYNNAHFLDQLELDISSLIWIQYLLIVQISYLQRFFRWTHCICWVVFNFLKSVVKSIPAIWNNSEIIISSEYHSHYCNGSLHLRYGAPSQFVVQIK